MLHFLYIVVFAVLTVFSYYMSEEETRKEKAENAGSYSSTNFWGIVCWLSLVFLVIGFLPFLENCSLPFLSVLL